jgi:hypothetical protein
MKTKVQKYEIGALSSDFDVNVVGLDFRVRHSQTRAQDIVFGLTI